MIFIGDFFAIGLVIVLCTFYFDKEYYMDKASKYFVVCLVLTALTAVTDLLSGKLLVIEHVPLWLNLGVNSAYFLVNIVTTTFIALFLFTKILEHSHDNHCMVYAQRGLCILFVVYAAFVALNLWTGWLFYFDPQGAYQRGPLNAMGYFITICQMVLVVICYCRNRKNASRSMRRALIQSFPVVVLCIIIQRLFPEIMLNGFIMALMDTVLFLSFQGQRQGVHTLTKLNDRHRFFKDVEMRITAGETFQVFLINLKNYSVINQKYGHMQGDEILYQFAFSLESLIKNSVAFHMNGTVFALILPYTSQKTAEAHCGTLLDFLEQGILCGNEQICMDYILVEYAVDRNESNAEEFYERLEYAASIAYQQKHRYIRYTPNMGDQMQRTRYLIERMQTIDRAHGFQVWYQPICCLSTGEFCSMEALIRLQEPDGTIVSPGEFIPLAEQTGLITSITWFVLEDVCEFLAAHPELRDVSVSINLPMTQLLEKGFTTRLNSTVDRHGIEHRRICLEFTERAILDAFEQTKEIMEHLTLAGYRFYLDDFGTGYSNFNCMLQLPFQFIKLDASLLRIEEPAQANYGLVQTLTSLFHNMGLPVIAEGAETQADVEALRRQGVDRIQGYAFAKPMPGDALPAFYKEPPFPEPFLFQNSARMTTGAVFVLSPPEGLFSPEILVNCHKLW